MLTKNPDNARSTAASSLLEQYGIVGADKAAIQKFADLDQSQQMQLISEYQTLNASTPINNCSKWIFSKSRTILATQKALGPKVAIDGREIPELPGVPLDNECIEKLGELEPHELLSIVTKFNEQSMVTAIQNPSSWLYSKARTLAATRSKGLVDAHAIAAYDDNSAMLELQYAGIDEKALEKLKELCPEDRAVVVTEFQSKSAEIQNPSSWLFSSARTRLSERAMQMSGKGKGAKGSGKGGFLPALGDLGAPSFRAPPASPQAARRAAAPAPVRNFGAPQRGVQQPAGVQTADLAQYGVDQLAQDKLGELDPQNQQKLLAQFNQLYQSGQINDPSKWLFAKARTMLSQLGGKGGGGGVGGPPRPSMHQAAHSPAQGFGQRMKSEPNLSDLGVTLDAQCQQKLDELTPEEKNALLQEFATANAGGSIRNPSGWLFGRARSKLVERVSGKSRFSPY